MIRIVASILDRLQTGRDGLLDSGAGASPPFFTQTEENRPVRIPTGFPPESFYHGGVKEWLALTQQERNCVVMNMTPEEAEELMAVGDDALQRLENDPDFDAETIERMVALHETLGETHQIVGDFLKWCADLNRRYGGQTVEDLPPDARSELDARMAELFGTSNAVMFVPAE